MAEPCPICQHAKREGIDAALADARRRKMVHVHFRVKQVDISRHIEHAFLEKGKLVEDACECEWCRLSPMNRLRRAWQEATHLDRERFCFETQISDVPF